jgi:hypothetical protein
MVLRRSQGSLDEKLNFPARLGAGINCGRGACSAGQGEHFSANRPPHTSGSRRRRRVRSGSDSPPLAKNDVVNKC